MLKDQFSLQEFEKKVHHESKPTNNDHGDSVI